MDGMALVALAAALAARPAVGDEIELRMDAGRVTLIATEARLTEVLAAWSRIGQTRFVDAEAVAGESVTLHLVDVGEAEALRILLRPATGYVAAPRRDDAAGASRYDRVKILGKAGRPLPARDAAAGSRPADPAGGDAGGARMPVGAPMPLEDLQRLLDAVSVTTGGGGRSGTSGARGAPPVRPA